MPSKQFREVLLALGHTHKINLTLKSGYCKFVVHKLINASLG